MAFMVGLRLFSCGLAGAAVIITHQTTKASINEKLYNWLPDKLKRRSYEPAPHSDPEPVSNAVRTMGIKVFGWLAGKFKGREPDPNDGSREFGGSKVDPEVLSKLIRISAKLAWLAVDAAAPNALKRSKVGLQIYKIVKSEIRSWCA